MRDDLLGGETPFLSASDMALRGDGTHRPLSIAIDGIPATRVFNLEMCALMWGIALEKPLPCTHDEFMRGYLGGANTDMRALGLGPLLSMAEVRERYEQLKAADVDGAIFRATPDEPPRTEGSDNAR